MQELDDRGYTKLLSNKVIFRELMTSFVYEPWVKDLDFSACELVKGSFVSRKYKKTFSDLLYKVKLRGRDLYVVILLEFKSAPARFVAVQMAGYIDFDLLAKRILALVERAEDEEALSLFLNWFKQLFDHGRIAESDYRGFERIYQNKEEVNMLIESIKKEKAQFRKEGGEKENGKENGKESEKGNCKLPV